MHCDIMTTNLTSEYFQLMLGQDCIVTTQHTFIIVLSSCIIGTGGLCKKYHRYALKEVLYNYTILFTQEYLEDQLFFLESYFHFKLHAIQFFPF